MYAPIILFAFNRLEPLRACVASLLRNPEAAESDLIVYVDGARPKKEGEEEKVEAVRKFVNTINGFKSVETHFSDINKGLGPSLIAGITEVMNRYGRAIVVEDDLKCSTNFLSFLNQGLDFYADKKDVFSVSGESVKVKIPEDYAYDIYFAPRAGCWGWATWKDRWETVDWELKNWDAVKKKRHAFNKWGGSDCYGMLKGWRDGKNKSWAIRFTYSQFLQHAESVFPTISKVSNEGFGDDATNCKPIRFNRFAMVGDKSNNKKFRFPNEVVEDKRIVKQRMFSSRLYVRIFYKILNTIS